MNQEAERQRLDKWLWAARFFKTRSLAANQIQKGRISINGQRPKPSRAIQIGDRLAIEKSPYVFEVEVLALNEQRRPATEARELYVELAESIERRQQLAAQHRNDRLVADGLRGDGRPSKRQRRQIIRFRHRSEPPEQE